MRERRADGTFIVRKKKFGAFSVGQTVEYEIVHFLTGRRETLRGEIVRGHSMLGMATFQIRRSDGQPRAGALDIDIDASKVKAIA